MSIAVTMNVLIVLVTLPYLQAEIDYLRYVKDGCFIKNEALSCVKYKALRIAKKTLFDQFNGNKTLKANDVISFVNLDNETLNNLTVYEDIVSSEPRSFISEWAELAKYIMKLMRDYFKVKGLRVNLPDGARTIEDENDDARGKRKRLAIIIPFLTLLGTLKTKLLLIPILLTVLFIKKLLLIAALLLPGLISTLKHCKHHPMTHYSYFGSDSSDYNSDYANSYSYGSGGGYSKDWASNRAYSLPKRASPAPVYITAPGGIN